MTIKWVKSDPLVMNGEPFCFGTRLTVRNILEMRASGTAPRGMIGENPELRLVGIAEAFLFASRNRARYADFFTADGTLSGPGFTAEEAAALPLHLRSAAGIVVAAGDAESAGTYR